MLNHEFSGPYLFVSLYYSLGLGFMVKYKIRDKGRNWVYGMNEGPNVQQHKDVCMCVCTGTVYFLPRLHCQLCVHQLVLCKCL